MINIMEIADLNGIKVENFKLIVEETEIIVENKKENTITILKYSDKKRLKALRALEKILGTKIELEYLRENEILAYIENEGFSKSIFSPVGQAMHEYNMVEEGDRIAVGVSGGKDSLTVLNTLVRIQKISKVNFEIHPIHIHPEEDTASTDKIVAYCKKLGLELQIIKTKLIDILFGEEEVKNPCFLCGRIRRGILYTTLNEQNLNKLVLGHHKDDIIETFLMNSLYQGNLHMMRPSYMSDHNITVIRPLAYVEEADIIRYVKKLNLPVLKSICPFETKEDSKRLRVKNLVKELAKEDENVRSIVLNSIKPMLK
ncbi:MAG: tRNA 2-thiocytidine biosynthesis TtcA family protein [Fusobacteriaceae bacterium]